MNFINFEDESDQYEHHKISNHVGIYDNFLGKQDFRTMKCLVKEKLDTSSINAGHSSVGYHPYTYTHYSCKLTDLHFFNTFMLKKIEKTLNKRFNVLRIYMSVQKPSEYGNFHTDDHGTDTYTVTIYTSVSSNCDSNRKYKDYTFDETPYNINTEDSPFKIKKYKEISKNDHDEICRAFNEFNINGNFSIKMPYSKDIVHSVPFVENRLVAFPSTFIHDGNSFNSNLTRTRVVIAFKLKEIK